MQRGQLRVLCPALRHLLHLCSISSYSGSGKLMLIFVLFVMDSGKGRISSSKEIRWDFKIFNRIDTSMLCFIRPSDSDCGFLNYNSKTYTYNLEIQGQKHHLEGGTEAWGMLGSLHPTYERMCWNACAPIGFREGAVSRAVRGFSRNVGYSHVRRGWSSGALNWTCVLRKTLG